MTFRNSVVGGTTLVRPAIKSPNYVTGVDGWSINADGSAEFNNITIRGGTVVSGTALYYDGPPGPGTLFLSISAAAGVDPYGNAYPAGLTVGKPGNTQVQLIEEFGGGFLRVPTNIASETRPGQIAGGAISSGATQRIAVAMQGPNQNNAGLISFEIDSVIADGSLPARAILFTTEVAGNPIVHQVDKFQTQVLPRVASTNSALYVGAPAGHTGRLLRLTTNLVDQLDVSAAGVMNTYAANAVNSWTPALTNAGTATYTTQFGWWQRIGKLIIFGAYIVVNAAGSGAGLVGLTAPVAIERTGRQNVALNGDNITGFSGSLSALALSGAEGGTGAVFERVRSSTGTNLTGAGVIAGSRFTLDGWYREA